MIKARFVPFALFVSVASILVMSTLCVFALVNVNARVLILGYSCVFGIWRNMNPVTTRIELSCLGLVGTFWLGTCFGFAVFRSRGLTSVHSPRRISRLVRFRIGRRGVLRV